MSALLPTPRQGARLGRGSYVGDVQMRRLCPEAYSGVLSKGARAVFRRLWALSREVPGTGDAECFGGYRTIAAGIHEGISSRHVARCLARLIEVGLVRRVRMVPKGGVLPSGARALGPTSVWRVERSWGEIRTKCALAMVEAANLELHSSSGESLHIRTHDICHHDLYPGSLSLSDRSGEARDGGAGEADAPCGAGHVGLPDEGVRQPNRKARRAALQRPGEAQGRFRPRLRHEAADKAGRAISVLDYHREACDPTAPAWRFSHRVALVLLRFARFGENGARGEETLRAAVDGARLGTEASVLDVFGSDAAVARLASRAWVAAAGDAAAMAALARAAEEARAAALAPAAVPAAPPPKGGGCPPPPENAPAGRLGGARTPPPAPPVADELADVIARATEALEARWGSPTKGPP